MIDNIVSNEGEGERERIKRLKTRAMDDKLIIHLGHGGWVGVGSGAWVKKLSFFFFHICC